MGLSCQFEPPMLKQLRVQLFSDISHEQKPQVSIQMFPQSKNQQTFHCEPIEQTAKIKDVAVVVIIVVAVAISETMS